MDSTIKNSRLFSSYSKDRYEGRRRRRVISSNNQKVAISRRQKLSIVQENLVVTSKTQQTELDFRISSQDNTPHQNNLASYRFKSNQLICRIKRIQSFGKHTTLSNNLSLLNYNIIVSGNNSQLISRLLQERQKWKMYKFKPSSTQEIHLIWGYIPNQKLAKLGINQMVSCLPNSKQLTNKGKLYHNISNYCIKNKIQMNFLPITFLFDKTDSQTKIKQNFEEFEEIFQKIRKNTNLSNTWIMKPTNQNQGRNITLFNNLYRFKCLIRNPPNRVHLVTQETQPIKSKKNAIFFHRKSQCTPRKKLQGVEIIPLKNKIQQEIIKFHNQQNFKRQLVNFTKYNPIVVQKYIQSPLLIDNKKFDIRIWALVDQFGNFYIYEQGYLRFSSEEYKLSEKTINNNFVHLTNHALQKYSLNYEQQSNLRRMQTLRDHLEKCHKGYQYENIIKSIHNIVKISMNACLSSTQSYQYKCRFFEIFGFDFMIDREMNVRLIEANSNPSITEDSCFLQSIIPKMINDSFKLTIDKFYGCSSFRFYNVEGLKKENSWIFLGQLNKKYKGQ